MSDEINPDLLYDEAQQLKAAGQIEEYMEALFKIIETHPDHVHTNMALAVFLQRQGKPDEAIQHASKVVEVQPNDPFSYVQLSVIYQRCGRIPEAEDAMARSNIMRGAPASTGQPETSKHAETTEDADQSSAD